MHSTSLALTLAATASIVVGSPTYVDHGVHPDGVSTRTYVDQGVHPDGTTGVKRFKRGSFEIIDLGVRDLPASSALRERTTDGISSCGSHWMPIHNSDLGSGYDEAVDEYCYHVTHTLDNKATVIGAGQYHAALIKDGYVLKGNVPAQVDFEIHNKMSDGSHTPNEDECKKYLKKMSETNSKCYGKDNIDTKGGTWQIGAEKISYHGLPDSLKG